MYVRPSPPSSALEHLRVKTFLFFRIGPISDHFHYDFILYLLLLRPVFISAVVPDSYRLSSLPVCVLSYKMKWVCLAETGQKNVSKEEEAHTHM